MADVVPLTVLQQQAASARPNKAGPVVFNRQELSIILKAYGQQVGRGEWRDYAIDMLKDRAIFSIYRRASEMPIYRVVKDPKLARKQGAFQILSASGQVLKRGHSLETLLRFFDKPLRAVD